MSIPSELNSHEEAPPDAGHPAPPAPRPPLPLPQPTVAERCGAWLFRHRTWSLVPLAALVVGAAWTMGSSQAPLPPLGLVLQAAAIGALLGAAAIRLHVAGRAQRGTSSRGVTFEAGTLVTTGAYAIVRNPLYLANVLIWCGLAMLTGSPMVVAAVIAVTGLQYHVIVLAEERYLAGRYGRRYAVYRRQVPRWMPRVFRRQPGVLRRAAAPFRWSRAVFREADTLLLMLLGAWLLGILSRGWSPWQPAAGVPAGGWALPAGAVLVWLAVKWRKKSSWSRRRVEG